MRITYSGCKEAFRLIRRQPRHDAVIRVLHRGLGEYLTSGGSDLSNSCDTHLLIGNGHSQFCQRLTRRAVH